MTTGLFSHSSCLYHDTGLGHPESPDRLRAVLNALKDPRFAALDRREAPLASEEQLLRVHSPAYVRQTLDRIAQNMTGDLIHLDADTVVGPGSAEAALRAAGAVCAAVDAVVAGAMKNAFCAVRPPGHHAEAAQAMGFCLFNNVAVGAMQARAVHGVKRIAVIDFDVHHGNGTQHMLQDDADMFFASSHEWPQYPGTGAASEHGPHGNVVNIPLPHGTSGAQFREAVDMLILPALEKFRPEFLFISAGFDAHLEDPLAGLRLREPDYAWVTRQLMTLAERHAKGRLVSVLEGGYNLEALAASAAAHVETLMTA